MWVVYLFIPCGVLIVRLVGLFVGWFMFGFSVLLAGFGVCIVVCGLGVGFLVASLGLC